MAQLRLESLTKTFEGGIVAVAGVSFAVDEGEIVSLLGPSGCGKTTLLRVVAGLERPDAGAVWYDGQELSETPPHQRDFGMVFQNYALFPHRNVLENVAFGLKMQGMSPDAIQWRAAEMLDLVDLGEFAGREITQLSGGQQQRVALARALAPGPRLLLLDEPLGALDRALRERLMLELRDILQGVGVMAIYVTHDQTEALAVADRVIVMNEGQLEQIGTPQQVYSQPASPFVARFLGQGNIIAGSVQRARGGSAEVHTEIGRFRPASSPSVADGPVELLLKPGAVARAMRTDQNELAAKRSKEGLDQFAAVVLTLSFRGRYSQMWVKPMVERWTEPPLMFELDSDAPWQVGDTLWLEMDPRQMVTLAAEARNA